MKNKIMCLCLALILVLAGCGKDSSNAEKIPLEGNNSQAEILPNESNSDTIEREPEDVLEEATDEENTSALEGYASGGVEYTLNEKSLSVPYSWGLTSEASDQLIFNFGDTDNNRGIIWYRVIPDIMKIDVGEESIITANDAVNSYKMECDGSNYSSLSEEWKDIEGQAYFDRTYTYKDDSGIVDFREVLIPINENEAVVHIIVKSEDVEYLKDVDMILNTYLSN